MTDNHSNIDTIFASAIEIESPGDREVYVQRACGTDPALRREVDRLLRAHFGAGSFLEAPVLANPATIEIALAEKPGTQIGPYKLLEEIGEGGFGVVYMAEQEEPVRRRVALKLIKPGMDSRDVIARFDAERQALALMDHPNVARVLDAGATEQGRPYFVMDLIKGIPITQYADEAKLSTRERLDLFLQVCQGVQHAHQKGVIHRDLKPSNVLVTLHGSKAVPKVIDFGVAKAIHHRLTERTLYTRYAQMIGTPLYMSPEQAALSGLDVDTRSDIYSLGVLLYELFTGTTPLARNQIGEASYDEIRQAIRETEPPTPSQRLATTEMEARRLIAARRGAEPGRVAELLRGDLDWITMKALEKDRTRRYETVGDFVQDISRYLSDEPIEARPPSRLYRARKFVRRNRTRLAVAACMAVALVAVIGSAGWLVGERSARLGAAARLAESPLTDAEAAIVERDWDGARVATLRAQGLVLSRGSDRKTERRVEELLRDLDMVARLEALQLELEERTAHGSGLTEISAPYEAAFSTNKLSHNLHVLERWDDALRFATSAVALRPTSAYAHLHLGIALHGKDRRDEAFTAFEQALRLEPTDAVAGVAHIHLGILLSERGLRDAAIDAYKEVLRLNPDNAAARFNVATVLLQNGQVDEAIAELRTLLKSDPDDAEHHVLLGDALARAGSHDEAIAAYREGIRLDPEVHGGRNNLAIELGQQGRINEAIAELREAVRLDPDGSEARQQLAGNLLRLGRLEEIVTVFGELRRRRPDDSEALATVVMALLGLGRHLEAARLYRDAFREEPRLATEYTQVFAAALSAANSSAGLGEDAGRLEEDARALLRAEALRWLRTCLELDREGSCELWFAAPDLACIRDDAELAKLPEEEAARFRAFWDRVRRREIPILERRVQRGELPGEFAGLRAHRRAVLPDLLTCTSIDAALADAVTVDLMAPGASWRYFPGRTEPSGGLEWTRADFDDSSWQEGPSGFGYGDGDDATTLSDMRGVYSTVYLRKEFEIEYLESYETVFLEVLVDDGYVAYLNGEEIGRANAGLEERPSCRALALWSWDDSFFGPPLDITDRLRRGANVLAVQGLNGALTSSDLSLLPVLRGIPKGRTPQAESFVAFRRVADGPDGEGRVAYLDGRLLELRGEHEAAIAAYEKAIGAGLDDPRPLGRQVKCWLALGRETDAEMRLRDALLAGARGLGGLWIELRERQGLELGEILRDWPKGAKPPITLSIAADEDPLRAVRIDLGPHFNVDVVADPGDHVSDGLDGDGTELIVFQGGEHLLRGVPPDRRVGVHRLGRYSEKNAVQLSPDSRDPLRIDVPRGRYAELRLLVTGGSCGSKVSSIPAQIELGDGRRRDVSIPCPDWAWMQDRRHALPTNVALAWGGMDPRVNGRVVLDGDVALYDVRLEIEDETELVALEIDPARAEYQHAGTRFHIFAITAMRRVE